MRVLLLALLLLLAATPARAGEPVDLELVLAADGSGSIDEQELRLQRESYAAALTDPEVLQAIAAGGLGRIAVAFTEWGAADSQHTVVDWHLIDGPAAAAAFADRLRAAPRLARGWNSISGAIDHAAGLLRANAYDGTRQVIDVSGDGPQFGGRPVETARDEAVLSGITINALAIKSPGGGYPGPGGMPLVEHYRQSVAGGFGHFVMVAEDRGDFARAIRAKLIREIAGSEPAGTRPGGTPPPQTANSGQ